MEQSWNRTDGGLREDSDLEGSRPSDKFVDIW